MSTRRVLVILAMVLAVPGCREVEEAATAGYEPAVVEEVANLEVKRVTFTEEGAERVDLQTATTYRRGGQTVLDYAALIYDGQGVPWVYTTSDGLTFLRKQVVVDRVEGDRVLLSSGLPGGAEVVTVGAAEVYGAELDIAGGH